MTENKEIDMSQETEVIKAIKEEYEAKLAEATTKFENTLSTMRTEHAKQLREILKTGTTTQVMEEEKEAEEDDEDIVSAAVKALSAKWKKKK